VNQQAPSRLLRRFYTGGGQLFSTLKALYRNQFAKYRLATQGIDAEKFFPARTNHIYERIPKNNFATQPQPNSYSSAWLGSV
jgi:hypothetical protein